MTHAVAALLGLLALGAGPITPAPTLDVQFNFDIASASGVVGTTWASVSYDQKHDELFTVSGGLVHVYNEAGMESYSFGGDGDLGSVERVAVLDSGETLVLTAVDGKRTVLRCDFRGERVGTYQVEPLPDGFEKFTPDRIQVQQDKVYLVEISSMRVLVGDLEGHLAQAYDLAGLVRGKNPDMRLGMSGFWADPAGNMVVTMPYAFTAFAVSSAGELRQFGTRGSSPGKFNIVGSVAVDEQGYLFVLDRLRSVVIVFDRALRFITEFGYRGDGPTNLIAPYDLAVGNGKVFVSQARERGVKVFRYEVVQPPPPAPPRAPAFGSPGRPAGAGRG